MTYLIIYIKKEPLGNYKGTMKGKAIKSQVDIFGQFERKSDLSKTLLAMEALFSRFFEDFSRTSRLIFSELAIEDYQTLAAIIEVAQSSIDAIVDLTKESGVSTPITINLPSYKKNGQKGFTQGNQFDIAFLRGSREVLNMCLKAKLSAPAVIKEALKTGGNREILAEIGTILAKVEEVLLGIKIPKRKTIKRPTKKTPKETPKETKPHSRSAAAEIPTEIPIEKAPTGGLSIEFLTYFLQKGIITDDQYRYLCYVHTHKAASSLEVAKKLGVINLKKNPGVRLVGSNLRGAIRKINRRLTNERADFRLDLKRHPDNKVSIIIRSV